MKIFYLFFLLISINLSTKLENKEKKSIINLVTKKVDEGIYNIILLKSNLALTYMKGLKTSKKNMVFLNLILK